MRRRMKYCWTIVHEFVVIQSNIDGKDDAEWVDHDKHRARLLLLDIDAAGAMTGTPHAVPIAADVDELAWSPTSDRLTALSEAPNNAAAEAPAEGAPAEGQG